MDPRLAADLEASGLSGFRLDTAQVTLSDEAADFGITQVPEFKWLVVSGRPGGDDVGLLANGQAIISVAALHALRAHTLDNCDIEPYSE
jgi:hypothetical protein